MNLASKFMARKIGGAASRYARNQNRSHEEVRALKAQYHSRLDVVQVKVNHNTKL